MDKRLIQGYEDTIVNQNVIIDQLVEMNENMKKQIAENAAKQEQDALLQQRQIDQIISLIQGQCDVNALKYEYIQPDQSKLSYVVQLFQTYTQGFTQFKLDTLKQLSDLQQEWSLRERQYKRQIQILSEQVASNSSDIKQMLNEATAQQR